MRNLKSRIKEIVHEKPGIKATQLVVDIVNFHYDRDDSTMTQFLNCNNIADVLQEMVKDKQLKQIEYINRGVSINRAKSLYFPVEYDLKVIE